MSGIDAADYLALIGTVASLVLLEGLLSADNALVLAVMVRHLPKDQQKRALRYGVIGAFVFRLIAVVFAASLLHYWIVKAAGGVYLLWIAGSHLLFGEGDGDDERRSRFGSGLWGTIIGVEMTDIIFSIDSILAAVATADGLSDDLGNKVLLDLTSSVGVEISVKLLVIYIGGVLGILAMRFVAGYFLVLLERFHGLATGAYFLVGWIGLKLIGGGFHDALHPNLRFFTPPAGNWRESVPGWVVGLPLDMNDYVFWAGMALLVVASLLYKPSGSSPVAGSVVQDESIPGFGPTPEDTTITTPAPSEPA